jgi:hypothetical protein
VTMATQLLLVPRSIPIATCFGGIRTLLLPASSLTGRRPPGSFED